MSKYAKLPVDIRVAYLPVETDSSKIDISMSELYFPDNESNRVIVATGLVGVGTTQATALLLSAITNVISSAPSGTGFILDGGILQGDLVVLNSDTSNSAKVYPPVGAQINNLGVNVPFVVGANGGRITFSTANSLSQWFAA